MLYVFKNPVTAYLPSSSISIVGQLQYRPQSATNRHNAVRNANAEAFVVVRDGILMSLWYVPLGNPLEIALAFPREKLSTLMFGLQATVRSATKRPRLLENRPMSVDIGERYCGITDETVNTRPDICKVCMMHVQSVKLECSNRHRLCNRCAARVQCSLDAQRCPFDNQPVDVQQGDVFLPKCDPNAPMDLDVASDRSQSPDVLWPRAPSTDLLEYARSPSPDVL